MKQGAWHQCGDRSQKLSLEQLESESGVGVVISPRDLASEKASEYAVQYRDAGAEVLIDQQFYLPDSIVGKLSTYEISSHRQTASQLHKLTEKQFTELATALRNINAELKTSAVIAPAVIFEAGRPDIVELNTKLFNVAKLVGNDLGIPTLATVVLGKSVTATDVTMEACLSDATSVDADGWYFAAEFNETRIPSSHSSILRFCNAGLTLACTGKPVFHAYAGPLCLLSPCFGATAVGIGHSQNLWQFTRERWQESEGGGGGGGDAPPRFFSSSLWGTIIYEDEFALLSQKVREDILTQSPFSLNISSTPPYLPWSRWDANKHLVFILSKYAENALAERDVEKAAENAIEHLHKAVSLHSRITDEGVVLADNTNSYQNPWRAAIESLKASQKDEIQRLKMLRALEE